MEFENKTIGNSAYICCRVPEECQIDTITQGMLLNNSIEGIAPVELTEMDEIHEYRFEITGLHQLTEIYKKQIRRQGLLTVLMTITETIIRARDYMIPQDRFLISDENIYVDMNTCRTKLLCLPAKQEEKKEMKECFADILSGCRTDVRESDSYVYFLQDYLKKEDVTVDSFHEMLGHVFRNEITIPERPRTAPAQKPVPSQSTIKGPEGSVLVKSMGSSSVKSLGVKAAPAEDAGGIRPLSSLMNKVSKGQTETGDIIRPLEEIMNAGRKNTADISAYKGEMQADPAEETDDSVEDYEETGLLIDEEISTGRSTQITGGYLIRLSTEERIEVRGREFVLGRSEEQADYAVLGNRWISNMHASIITTAEGCYLRDLGSMNHTYLNDNQVFGKNEVLIPNQAVIRLGNERFRFCYH